MHHLGTHPRAARLKTPPPELGVDLIRLKDYIPGPYFLMSQMTSAITRTIQIQQPRGILDGKLTGDFSRTILSLRFLSCSASLLAFLRSSSLLGPMAGCYQKDWSALRVMLPRFLYVEQVFYY